MRAGAVCGMTSGRLPIVYFYPHVTFGADAARHTCLSRALSEHTDVIFIETAAGTRRPGRVAGPQMHEALPTLKTADNVLGYTQNRYARRLRRTAAIADRVNLKRLLRRNGIDDYVLWASAPVPDLLASFDTTRLVYDCIDPCFLPEEQERFDAAERTMASRAGVVFATAETLRERMAAMHRRAYLLNNAADPALCNPSEATRRSRPGPLTDRRGPVIGYLGTIDWRIDTAALTAAATALPEYTFCIAGRINHDQEENTRVLRGLPNVVAPGQVPVADGPAYTAAFDVGLIPYLPGDMGDAINPVKMYMYLALGIPTVATSIREARAVSPLVTATGNVEEFIGAIRRAVESDSTALKDARIAFAAANSWAERARTAIRHLNDAGMLSG